jgi:two-component sensor histidine kinase
MMSSSQGGRSDFEREVARRFGILPNFFVSAPDAPEIIEKLWDFAKSAYLDNPMPALFKERLFVYLSRFCEVRYCILRHCAFLLGYGHSSGDPTVESQTIAQAIQLLKKQTPWQRSDESWLAALESHRDVQDWPTSETELEDQIFCAAASVFVEPGRAERSRRALRQALGGRRHEHLMGLLAFIRTAHYWTVVHPDLVREDDVRSYLGVNEELAQLLLEDPEAARCDMGRRLFSELTELRELHERRLLEAANRALEAKVDEKELLLKEANHRVKNSLQIVSSILHLQISGMNPEAAAAMRSASARILAIAAVHERLYTSSSVTIVSLSTFLGDLCRNIGRALEHPDGVEVDVAPVDVPTDMAVPLALIVNELVTNAIKYGALPCRIEVRNDPSDMLLISISDRGNGPSKEHSTGFGSRIVEALSVQLGAKLEAIRTATGYSVRIEIALPGKVPIHEGSDRRG